MRSWMTVLVAGTLLGTMIGSAPASADSPQISPEVQSIVDSAYDEWYGSLGSRQSCSSGVTMVYEVLDGRRGEYRTKTGEVVIDPTDSTSAMGAIVVHELGHHTFLACGVFADEDFTAAFYASQGLPEDRDWFDYAAGWAATPAEHFAEAMAITIYGSGEGGIPVATETTALVSRWLSGAPIAPPAVSHDPVPYSSSASGQAEDQGTEETGAPSPVASEPTQPTQETVLVASTVELAADSSVSVFSVARGSILGL